MVHVGNLSNRREGALTHRLPTQHPSWPQSKSDSSETFQLLGNHCKSIPIRSPKTWKLLSQLSEHFTSYGFWPESATCQAPQRLTLMKPSGLPTSSTSDQRPSTSGCRKLVTSSTSYPTSAAKSALPRAAVFISIVRTHRCSGAPLPSGMIISSVDSPLLSIRTSAPRHLTPSSSSPCVLRHRGISRPPSSRHTCLRTAASHPPCV
ncbi:hypothetical protein QBC40DRAFT_345436 [Triangularia verruculosa]|uniref:Uncharacterized protein n=1 Tax=Triangularia verruculosa TaxID=2587418 RepID=A0AAN6XPZ6_9PEZI|nr:hypothetical protein QBC40DRAFT_345436 [Triangularia verruculosa]